MFQCYKFCGSMSRTNAIVILAFVALAQLTASNSDAQEKPVPGQDTEAPQAEDQTLDEFRKYASEKLPKLSKAKIDLIVKRVDKNNNEVVSESEFADRVSVFRDVSRGPEPWIENLEAARTLAKETGKPLLVYARAEWCPACRQYEKDTLPTEAVQSALTGFVLFRLDIDENEDASQEFGINAVPMMLVESTEGEQLKSLGAKQGAELTEWLTEAIAKSEPEDDDR